MNCYIINLDRSQDRLTYIKSIFTKAGLSFIRVSAVEGRTLPEDEYQEITRICNWSRKLSKAEVGCFLSHRECWRLIAEGNDPYGAIFEDDIKFSSHANLFLKNSDWIPEGCDIVKLDTAKINCVLGKFDTQLPENYKLGRLVTKHYGTSGYIISKSCAKRLYDENKIAIAPIDEILYNPVCGVFQSLKIEQMFPAIVVQAGLNSTILSERKQIKNGKRTQRPLLQKIGREFNRFKRRYLVPWYLKTFRGCFWGIVPFH